MATVRNASWLLSSPFASPPKPFSGHTARAIHSFIHLFMQPHSTPPHHHIISLPGLVIPCLALPCLACLPCPFLIRTLLPLAALQTTKTLILMSSSSSSTFFYSYLALNPFSFEACVVIVVVFFS
jgi:cation transport ATPase